MPELKHKRSVFWPYPPDLHSAPLSSGLEMRHTLPINRPDTVCVLGNPEPNQTLWRFGGLEVWRL